MMAVYSILSLGFHGGEELVPGLGISAEGWPGLRKGSLVWALVITYTILGVPCYHYGFVGPQTLGFQHQLWRLRMTDTR